MLLLSCVAATAAAACTGCGGHSPNWRNHTWPGQLQIMLDKKYPAKYAGKHL